MKPAVRIGLMAAVLVAAGCSRSRTDLARVDGKPISKDEVADRMLQGPEARQAMRSLILSRILQNKAAKEGITVSDADIARYLQVRKDQYPPGRLDEAMATSGTTTARMREDARTDLLMRAIEMKGVTVSDESIKKYYDADLNNVFEKPEWVQFGTVITKDKADAEAAASALAQKADFITVAGKFDIPQAKQQGVGLQWIGVLKGAIVNEQRQPASGLDPTFSTAVKKLPEGQSSKPMAIAGTPYYQIVVIQRRVPGGKYALDQIKPEIAFAIATQNGEIKQGVLEETVKGAKVELLSDQFKGLDKPEAILPTQRAPQQ